MAASSEHKQRAASSSGGSGGSSNAMDLLASSEILRQGALSRHVPSTGRWLDVHAVLTRAGYLHLLPPSAVQAAADAAAAAAKEAEAAAKADATTAKAAAAKDGAPPPPPRPSRLLPSVLPADTLALARCDLEAADATTLQLVEGHGGGGGGEQAKGMLPAAAAAALGLVLGARPGRCVRLRAPGAEESCEWAIVIRESISLLKQQ